MGVRPGDLLLRRFFLLSFPSPKIHHQNRLILLFAHFTQKKQRISDINSNMNKKEKREKKRKKGSKEVITPTGYSRQGPLRARHAPKHGHGGKGFLGRGGIRHGGGAHGRLLPVEEPVELVRLRHLGGLRLRGYHGAVPLGGGGVVLPGDVLGGHGHGGAVLGKVVPGPAVAPDRHLEDVVGLPGVEVDRLHKGDVDPQGAVDPGAPDADVGAVGDRGPVGIGRPAVKAGGVGRVARLELLQILVEVGPLLLDVVVGAQL